MTKSFFELVEMRSVKYFSEYDFPGDDTPIIQGSALKALEDPDGEWETRDHELMDAVYNMIPTPERATDKPFLMPVEDVFLHHRTWNSYADDGSVEHFAYQRS